MRRIQVQHPHQEWTIDIYLKASGAGSWFRFLDVINGQSWLCMAIDVIRRCKAKIVVTVRGSRVAIWHLRISVKVISLNLSPTLLISSAKVGCLELLKSNLRRSSRMTLRNRSTDNFRMNSWITSSSTRWHGAGLGQPLEVGIRNTHATLSTPGTYVVGGSSSRLSMTTDSHFASTQKGARQRRDFTKNSNWAISNHGESGKVGCQNT